MMTQVINVGIRAITEDDSVQKILQNQDFESCVVSYYKRSLCFKTDI